MRIKVKLWLDFNKKKNIKRNFKFMYIAPIYLKLFCSNKLPSKLYNNVINYSTTWNTI